MEEFKKETKASPSPRRPGQGRVEKWVQALPEGLSARRPTAYSPELAAVQASTLRARSQWEDLKEQATLAYESGLLPRSIDTRERAITIALMGKELGVAPMQALCGIYVVNGMMALRGSLMLRLIYERVPGARISVLTPPEQAEQECAVEMQRPHGVPQVFRYTLEDAKKAGFMNKPIWQQHTATMLRWAAIRTGARIIFADAIAGCYMEDEIPASETTTMPVESPEVPVRAASTEPAAEGTAQAAVSPQPMPPVRTVVSALPKAVTEKQVNRLYAIAHEKRWTRAEVALAVDKWFHKKEPRLLNRVEYDRLCQFLLDDGNKEKLSDEKLV